MSMNVSLTPELEKYVESKVKSGMYNSASEVVRESLRLLRRQDELESVQIKELREEVRRSVEQVDAGQGVPLADVRSKLQKRRSKS